MFFSHPWEDLIHSNFVPRFASWLFVEFYSQIAKKINVANILNPSGPPHETTGFDLIWLLVKTTTINTYTAILFPWTWCSNICGTNIILHSLQHLTPFPELFRWPQETFSWSNRSFRCWQMILFSCKQVSLWQKLLHLYVSSTDVQQCY